MADAFIKIWGAKVKAFNAVLATTCFLASLTQGLAWAADSSVADFYRGKVVNIYVGTSEGGAIDVYPRLMSDYLTKYMPGNPQVIVRNMPGASGVNATNYIYAVAPQDGTAYGFATRGILYGPLFEMQSATYDPKKLNWIGSTTKETSVITVWSSSSPVKTIEDVRTQEVFVGATAGTVGNMDIFPELLNKMAGMKFKVIRGYKGAPQVVLAMEAGEIQGRGAWSWGSLKSSHMDWVKEGKIRVLVQFGLEKASDLPDVPLALDLMKKPEDKQLMEMICAPISLGYPSFLGPKVPHERVEAVRTAYMATLHDPDFLALADKRQLEVDPVTGEDIRKVIDEIYGMPKPIVERAKAILGPNL